MAELNVDIELFPMPKSDGNKIASAADEIEESKEPVGSKVNIPPNFDITKFYASVISFDED